MQNEIESNLAFYEQHVDNIRIVGHQAYARCPFHEDKVQSLSINLETSQFKCHAGCGAGNSTSFSRRIGIPVPIQSGASFPASGPSPKQTATSDGGVAGGSMDRVKPAPESRRIVAEYEYQYEDGSLAYQVVRFDPKGFVQRRMVDGKWSWSTQGIRRVPFRLPKILATDALIFLVEGEKDAIRLESINMVATTTPMGAGNWLEEYAAPFKGKKVVVIPDNDAPGEEYATTAAKDIRKAGGMVKIVRLPNLKEHGDVSDFLDNVSAELEEDKKKAGERDALMRLVVAAPVLGHITHSNEDPLDYFKRNGIDVVDGAGVLPHEFKTVWCRESYGLITSRFGDNVTEEVHSLVEEANDLWQKCRTRDSYWRFLCKLKLAHEITTADKA